MSYKLISVKRNKQVTREGQDFSDVAKRIGNTFRDRQASLSVTFNGNEYENRKIRRLKKKFKTDMYEPDMKSMVKHHKIKSFGIVTMK